MDTVVVIIAVLVIVTSALLAFCLTESKGTNTKYARKDSDKRETKHSLPDTSNKSVS